MVMRRASRGLAKTMVRYRVHWAIITMGLNLAAILTVLFVFPKVSNLWVSVFVLVGGFTSSVTALGDLLVSAEDADL